MICKRRLMTPGPTQVPPTILGISSLPTPHHRSEEFSTLFSHVSKDLKYLFATTRDVITLSSGGTGGMEACVVNLTDKGEKVIVISGGVFGERWAEICRQFGRIVIPAVVPWGESIDPDVVRQLLKENPDTTAVFATLSETSTGVQFPIQELGEIVAGTDACFVVDAIGGLGACELRFDEWHIDATVSGTQKGLMMPPGLALIALSEKAERRSKNIKENRFYFSFEKILSKLRTKPLPTTPWTPNISLIYQLGEALKLIKEEGIVETWKRHRTMAQATRAALTGLGLPLYAKNSPSDAVTTVHSPENIKSDLIIAKLKQDWGIHLANGQQSIKSKIFRIGHLGYCDYGDILTCIAALEVVLKQLGYSFSLGSGVSAAQEVFLKESLLQNLI